MTVFFFFLERSQFLKDEARTKKKKKKLLDVFVVSHTLTWRSKFKESHWSVSDLTCQISWWGFSSTCFFFFFSGKNLSLFCVGGKHKQYIYIYPLSLFCLPSFCCYTSFPFLPIFLQRYPVCLSLSLFFFPQESTFSISESPSFFFISSLSVISHSLSSPHFLCHVGTQAHSPDQPGLYNWLPPSSAQHCTYNIVAFQFLI